MKKQIRNFYPAIGGSSLLVIFAVLCLTVFALLSLSTVQAEKRLSDTAAEVVAAYYEADLEAERIFAGLRAGDPVSGVREDAGIFFYACPISENQTLMVEVQKTEDVWKVLRWEVEAQPEEISQTMPVWDGR